MSAAGGSRKNEISVARRDRSRSAAAAPGLLVLGMHRSGTSLLAHLLAEAGASMGERVIPGSRGNEEGHWEDAFAVETNDRLLSALGRRWDDARPLPDGWMDSTAARKARASIAAYVRGRGDGPWAIKDPRMCVLAEIWVAAMREAGVTPSVVLLSRHPWEVAQSLAVRDGLGAGRSVVSWLRHVLAAERATRDLPRTGLTYDALLKDPAAALEAIRALPGGAWLPDGGALEGVIQRVARPGLRHHRSEGPSLPQPVALAWAALQRRDPEQARDGLDSAARELAQADSLITPLLDDVQQEQRQLWDRVSEAEHAVSAEVATSLTARLGQLNVEVAQLGERLVHAITNDIQGMQAEHARLLGSSASLQAQAGLAGSLSPKLDQLDAAVSELGQRMTAILTEDIRRMQAEHARLLESSASLQAQAGLAGSLSPKLDQLDGAVSELGQRMTAILTEDIRRMQAEVTGHAAAAAAMRAALAESTSSRQLLLEQLQSLEATLGTSQALQMMAEVRLAEVQEALRREREHRAVHEALVERAAAMEAELSRSRAQWQHDAELLRQVRASKSWRLTRPLRAARRMVAMGGPSTRERQGLRQWCAARLATIPLLPTTYRRRMQVASRVAVGVAVDRPGSKAPAAGSGSPWPIHPAAQVRGRPDVFVWAVIDWHFRMQRPQHLARGLAEAGHRVFYVSNNLVDDPRPGFRAEALDASGRLFQVNLHGATAPAIYYAGPSEALAAQLRESIGGVMQWADSDGGYCIVQHPFWSDVAKDVSGSALLYDCMDHHAGFENNAPDVLAAEHKLIEDSDLLVVTSEWLEHELAGSNPNRALIRNAAEYDHFCKRPERVHRDPAGRRVIGYYGAIAEWFDVELVRAVALAFPECSVLMIGGDTAGASASLADLGNVSFTGEVPYAELPYYLHGFDVALLPFKVIPLTLATNPVKVYEYLSAGKPVVSVDLPEIAQFGDLVATASNRPEFVDAVRAALREDDPARARARREFASTQTWSHRALELDAAISAMLVPKVSVVVLTYNNLEYTKACLHSVEADSHWPDLEVIVVDNASTDGTPEFLESWQDGRPNRKVILNQENLGFSGGNNVGLAAATGDYLVLLNNDTYVTPNWVRTLVNHLRRNPGVGIVGPVTNNIGNEARIEVHYRDMAEMRAAAARHTRSRLGRLFDIRTVAFFCVAMPRHTYEQVGPMDEDFGVGFFEDDDYCRRVQAAGLRVCCADDVFVHHHLSASFDKLGSDRKRELFERNKAIYEAKWGPWTPHSYRGADG